MSTILNEWSSGMMTHIQQNEMPSRPSAANLPQPSRIAVIAAVIFAGLFFTFSLPLMVTAGLWLLGLAVTLIGYALLAKRQFETPMWDTAIIGQALGLLGMALLFGASLLT